MTKFLRNLAISILLLSTSACGYRFQNSQSNLRDQEDIYTVYVYPFYNATHKPGVENVVYNSVIRSISSGRRIKIVYNIDDADALFTATINSANLDTYSDTTTFSLVPKGLADAGYGKSLTSVYEGILTCAFTLVRSTSVSKKPRTIWSGSFTRKKAFPTSARLGPQGTTTSIINESEFDRAIVELSDRIADDMHESMMAMF